MRKKSTRSKFTNEFKKKAVEMTLADDITVSAVADSLGIPNQYLSKWRAELLVDGKIAEAEKKLEALEENTKLKDENRRLKMEVEILRKAASYFASHR